MRIVKHAYLSFHKRQVNAFVENRALYPSYLSQYFYPAPSIQVIWSAHWMRANRSHSSLVSWPSAYLMVYLWFLEILFSHWRNLISIPFLVAHYAIFMRHFPNPVLPAEPLTLEASISCWWDSWPSTSSARYLLLVFLKSTGSLPTRVPPLGKDNKWKGDKELYNKLSILMNKNLLGIKVNTVLTCCSYQF